MATKNNSMQVSGNVVTNDSVMKVSEAKKLVKTAFENEFLTPFKCLIWSNKNKNKEGFTDLYKKYGITNESGSVRNLVLDDLLNVLPEGCTDDKDRVFCKLVSSDKDGKAVSTFVDKNDKVWYLVPIKYSTNEFFASVSARQTMTKKETALKLWEADADKRKEHEAKKRKKLEDKIAELKENESYKSLTAEQIELVARDITGVRLSLS